MRTNRGDIVPNRWVPFVFACFCVSLAPCCSQESGRAEGAAALDRVIPRLLEKHHVPGAALAVMKDGRLVLARGYGLADKEHKVKARPDSLFRIASVSKPLTAVGVLILAQEGRISLDEGAFSLLDDLAPFPGATPDPRLHQVTVRDLLRHSGGWDPQASGDPQFMNLDIAAAMGLPPPVTPRTIIRYWIGRPLDHGPGTRYAYSNFGYNVLGRIIEKVACQTYEDFIQSRVLLPLGIRRMRIGATLREQRAEGEGAYYAQPGAALCDSVYPVLGEVPEAYGSWSHQALDAHGGWIASAVDMLRFVRGLEGSGGRRPLLSEEMIRQMTAFQGLEGQSSDRYYALGWNVEHPGTPEEQWSHAGALSGSSAAWLVHQANGISYALLFNSLPDDYNAFFDELVPLMKSEISKVRHWPEKDLFSKYP